MVVILSASAMMMGYSLFRRHSDSVGLRSMQLQLKSYQQIQDGFETLKKECRRESETLKREIRNLLNHILELRERLAKVSDEPLPPLPVFEAMADTPTEVDLSPLKQALLVGMSMEELRSMAWDLGYRTDGLTTPVALLEDMLIDFKRRGKIGRILGWVAERRPDIKVERTHV